MLSIATTESALHLKGYEITSLSATRAAHSHPEAAYILPADELETNRLVVQHYLLKRLFGANVLAPITWKEGDRVLDACTGSAVWLLDLAREIPEYVHLTGNDIETRQFPASESRPKNMELSVHSVLSLPLEWTDMFTLVHQRLLIAGLRRTEWPQALKELHRVTKPGGWVELCELVEWRSGPVNERWTTQIATKVYSDLGLDIECGKHVGSMMREAGFTDIQVVNKTTPFGPWGGDEGKAHSENILAIWKGIKHKVLNVGGYVESEEEMDRWLFEIEKEYNESPNGTIDWVVCYGRKALV